MSDDIDEETVNHPPHYKAHPSGVECIEITEHMNFNLGNAMKYIWRADEKGSAIEDLKKAVWYVEREMKKRQYILDLPPGYVVDHSQLKGVSDE